MFMVDVCVRVIYRITVHTMLAVVMKKTYPVKLFYTE